MTGLTRIIGLISIFSLLPPSLAISQTATSKPRPVNDRQVKTEIEAAVSQAAEAGFSGAVLVARGGKLLFYKGYGLANRDHNVAIKPETVFDAGSLAKMFTAVAVYTLQQQGKLAISDRLAKFFTNVPADKSAITLQHLLTHTSGLLEYHDSGGDFEKMTKERAIAQILGQNLRFEPGTREAYSNSGYTLLAAVIEKASGRAFPAYLTAHLFGPAGMKKTGFWGNPGWRDEEVARGYNGQTVGENSPRTWPEVSWVLLGSGGIATTVGDLYRWHQKMKGTEILSEETKRSYYAVRPGRWMAGGTQYGFFAVYAEFPADDGVVIVARNSGGPPSNIMELHGQIARLLGHIAPPAEGQRKGAAAPPIAAAAAPEPAKAGSGRLPDTPVGRVASAYFAAFNSGDENLMKDFFLTHLSAAALSARPVEPRLNFYRQVRDGLVRMEILGYVETGKQKLAVTIKAKTGAMAEVRFEMDSAEPKKLLIFQVELK